MITREELEAAAFWDQELCTECGTLFDTIESSDGCPECGSKHCVLAESALRVLDLTAEPSIEDGA